ncbi:hypothetical protein REPUB_Repub14bG0163200 [Reevesia pubescens]
MLDLFICHLNLSAMRRLAQRLEEEGADSELRRYCERILRVRSSGWTQGIFANFAAENHIGVYLGSIKGRGNIIEVREEVRDQKYDEKANTVTITVVSSNPECIKSKISSKAVCCIKSIEIKQPEKEKKPPEKPPNKTPTKPEMINIVRGGSAGIVVTVAACLVKVVTAGLVVDAPVGHVKGVAALLAADAMAGLLVVGTAIGGVKVAAALLATANLVVGTAIWGVKSVAANPVVAGATFGLVVVELNTDTIAGIVKGAAAILAADAVAVVGGYHVLVVGAAAANKNIQFNKKKKKKNEKDVNLTFEFGFACCLLALSCEVSKLELRRPI